MNPDTSAPDYQRMVARQNTARAAEEARQHALHVKAVARRRKAKRGGKR